MIPLNLFSWHQDAWDIVTEETSPCEIEIPMLSRFNGLQMISLWISGPARHGSDLS